MAEPETDPPRGQPDLYWGRWSNEAGEEWVRDRGGTWRRVTTERFPEHEDVIAERYSTGEADDG